MIARRWIKVRAGRWRESWATCLLHLQSAYVYEDYGARDHLWLEETPDGAYQITYGGSGSTGILAASPDARELGARLESDEAIDRLWASS